MANLLAPLSNFNKNVARVNSPWNRALNDLRYAINGPLLDGEQGFTGKNISWRYFMLENPPKAEEFIPRTDNDYIPYEDVQASIKNLADNIEDRYGKNDNNKNGYDFLVNLFQYLREESLLAEESLYNSLKVNTQYEQQSYHTLVDNSKKYTKVKQGQNVENNTSIGFWTKALYNILQEDEELKTISQKDAFAIIIASNDFYHQLKGGSQNKFYPSIFTRHSAYKAMLQDKNLISKRKEIESDMNKLTDTLDRRSLEYLYNQFNNNIYNLFTNPDTNNSKQQEFADKIAEKLKSVMGTYFNISKKGKLITSKLKAGKKNVSATQASSLIRTKMTEEIRKLSKDAYFVNYVQLNDNFTLTSSDTGEVYFSIEIAPTAKNKLYDSARNFSGEKIKIVQHILNTLANEIKNFNPSKEFIDLNSLKVYYQEISVIGEEKTGIQGLKQGAINFINAGQIKHFLNSTYQKRTYWKEFNIANNNAFLSGFLGELAGEFLSLNLLGELDKSILSGSAFSIFNKNKTYSVNDLKIIQKEKMIKNNKETKKTVYSFGINIKHYIYNGNKDFTLYGDGNKMSIYSSYISKYLGMSDTQLLRFIVENGGYFDSYKDTLQFATYSLAMRHLPEFIRIHDYSKNTKDNLFFLINNILYPTSYIYDTVLSQLNKKVSQRKVNNFIEISIPSKQPPKASYNNIEDAKENWKEEDYELRKLNSSSNGQDVLIGSKGLKVNLVNLSLFK